MKNYNNFEKLRIDFGQSNKVANTERVDISKCNKDEKSILNRVINGSRIEIEKYRKELNNSKYEKKTFNQILNGRIEIENYKKELKNSEYHTSYVFGLTVLQNGNLVSSSLDKTIKIWNPTTGAAIQTITGHTSVVWSLTGLYGNLVSGSDEKTIKIWNPKTGTLIQTLTGHTSAVKSLTVLQNDNLVSGSTDATNAIKIWN